MKIINFLLKPYASIFELLGLLLGAYMIFFTNFQFTGCGVILITPSFNYVLCMIIEKSQ